MDPNASHYIEVVLKLCESKEFVFILGYVENAMNEKWESKNVINKNKAKATINRFDIVDQQQQLEVHQNLYKD